MKKILKTRRPEEAKDEKEEQDTNSMDIDVHPANAELSSTPTTTSGVPETSAMDISSNTLLSGSTEAQVAATPPTAEELRERRLRRFGGASSAATTPSSEASHTNVATTGTTNASAANTTTPPISITFSAPVPTAAVSSSTSSPSTGSSIPSSSLGARLLPSATPFNTPSEHSGTIPTSTPPPVSSSLGKSPSTPGAKNALHSPHPAQPFDYHVWLHRTICQIFSVRTNASPTVPTSSFGSDSQQNVSKTHLFNMQAVLDSRTEQMPTTPSSPASMDVVTPSTALQFIIDDIDIILVTILSTPSSVLPKGFKFFDYLAHCLSRLDGARRSHPVPAVQTETSEKQPHQALTEATIRIYNYFALASTSAPMFASFAEQHLIENPEYVSEQYVRVLGHSLLSREHLSGIVSAIGEKSLPAVFEPVFLRCAALSRKHSAQVEFNSKSQRPIQALRALVSVGKPLVEILVRHPRWTVKETETGREVDTTILGCLFSYTPLFALMRSDTEGAMATIPTATINELFFEILKYAKDPTLDWIATVLMKNKDALKMGAGETLSSTGFANSFSTAMLKIAKPFMDRSTDKNRYANFDPNYFVRSHRLGSFFDSSDTHLVADKSTFEAWKSSFNDTPVTTSSSMDVVTDSSSKSNPETSSSSTSAVSSASTHSYQPNFITESFHMTLLSLILQNRVYRIYADIFERHAELKRAPERGDGGFATVENFARIKAILEDVIFSPAHMQEAFLFWEMVGIWLARAASTPDNVGALSGSTRFDPPSLPLASTPPKSYQCLPEVIIESLLNFFMFAAHYWPKFSDQIHTDIMNSVVTLLASPQYVKNPHIRVKMVQVLTVLMPRNKGGRLQPTRVSPFDSNFVVSQLGIALTNLYIDVERTGSASQFYDRLNARHQLSSILVFLWSDMPGHKETIIDYWGKNPEAFKSFADKLLNDSIFLLDEGRSKLLESHGAAQKLEAGGSSLSPQDLRDLRETAERGARQTQSYMVLLKESLKIFSMVAIPHADLFIRAGMHERLATSLNYCLYQIYGPKRHELRMVDASKYEFDPAWVVDKLCSCISAFAVADKTFIDYLAKDTRSYSEELYANASSFIATNPVPDSQFMPKVWNDICTKVKECTLHTEEMEEELGDIPDDFLDPLMSTLMTDPVILPSSKITVDRATIERALLADPIDPYNRSPLSVEQLIPNTELKAQIDAFIAERRRK